VEAERVPLVGGTLGQPQRHVTHRQREHVQEYVRRIRQQRQAVGQNAADDLGDEDHGCDAQSDDKPPPHAPVVVVVIVIVAVHSCLI
jgi:hypothetical protein